MIRKFIAQFFFIFLITIPFTVSAQLDSVKYILVYDTTTCHYNVCIKIVGGSATSLGQRTQANSTISMVMAASDTMEIEQLFMPLRYNQTYTGTEPTTWNISTQVFEPAAQPESNFYTIVPSLSPASQYNNLATGDTIKLFSIRVWNKATGEPLLNCGRTIRFFRNGIDPGSGEPGMNSGDFSNGFTVGSFKQLYRGNLDPVTPPKPTLNYEINCTNDISLNLQPQTTLCQQPLKFGWSGPGGYSSLSEDIMITPASSFNNGLYSVTVTDEYECEEILQIELERKPNAGTDIVLCGGGSTTLSASADNPGTWTPDPLNGPGANISNASNPSTNVTFAPGSTGVYAFIYESSVCSDTVRVTILDAVSVNIVGDNQFCPGNSVTLSTDAGSDFVWSTGATTPSIDVSAPGTYRVTITDTDGCTATASHVVTALTPPTAVISGDDEVCQGGSATFTASGGVSYEWSTGLPGPTITVSDNSPQVVTVTDANGCTDTAEKSLIINPEPIASVSGDDDVCTGGSATFTASGGVSYLWNSVTPGATIVVSDNTPQVVLVTDANGCTATAEKTLTINPEPIVSISGDDEICAGNTATFTASGGNTYLWQSGSTSATISVSNNMTQIVTVTDANGCTATAEKTLTINPNPIASISGDNEVCDGGSVTFTASGGVSYEWNLGTPGASIMVSDNTTQVVTVTDANGCTDTAQKTLNILASPVAVISGDNEVCDGGSVTFTASGGVSYLWNSVIPGATIVVTDNTTQEVMVTDANGCTATAEKTLTINANPTAFIIGDDEVCDGGSVTFTANGGNTYLWNIGNQTTQSITVSTAINAIVTVTDANNCTATAEKTLTINANPTASITGADEVCDGGSVLFTANGGNSYVWSIGNQTTQSITVSNGTPVRVTVTDANGCTATAEKTLTINANPTASITGADEVCDGGSVTFTANGGNTYLWSIGNQTTQSITVSTATTAIVTVTDANNCTATAEKTLIIHTNPIATITGDDSVCQGENATFTANGGSTYLWSIGNQTTQSITVSTNTPVSVTVTDANNCTATATKTLTVHPIPDAGADQSVNCYATDIATLQATGTGTWTLVAGPNTATITNLNAPNTTVTGFSGPGTYELIWSNGFCEDRVLITVGNNCACPPGDNQITEPSVTEACGLYPSTTIIGNDATPSGGSYIWEMETNGLGFVAASGTNNQKDYTTPVLNPGTYRIRRVYNVMANGQDCTYESNIVQIEVNDNPIATISGDDEVCLGGSVTFTANGGNTYLWSIGNQTTQSITVSNGTPVGVTVTDSNGCTDTAEKTLTVNANPIATITGDDEVCLGGSVTFTANGGNTYLWSIGNQTTQSITVSNGTPVGVTVTDANGCTDTAEKTLTVNANPIATISGNDEVCLGGSVTFTANGGNTYLWNIGNQTTQSITVSTATTAIVTVTDANNCTATAEKTLSINPNPVASISGDDAVCQGGSAIFTANGGDTYLWSIGNQTTQSITVSNGTSVGVTVTDANGCTDTAEKTLTVNANPIATITGDDEVCQGENATFTANGGSNYLWSIGNQTTQSITVSTNTPVSVTVTDANNCTATATKTLTVHPIPDAGADQSVNCYATDIATLQATGTGTWTLVAGPNTATITNLNASNTTVTGFSGPGTYELIWSNGFCEDRVLITVGNNCACPPGDNQITEPSVTEACGLYPSTTIIGNDATPSGGSYIWEMETNGLGFVAASGTNNQKDYTTPVLNPGTYRIRRVYNVMANGQDCVYESNIVEIEVHDNPIASISGDDAVCQGGSVTFTANGGTNYLWNIGNQVTQSITVSMATTAIVTVTDANNCIATAEKTLTIYSNPTANIAGDDEICVGGSAVFTANGGVSYDWNIGPDVPGITVSDNTTRIVTVTDANGCTATAEKTLIINPNPVATISGDDEVCMGGSVTFTANGGNTYLWSIGNQTTQNITVSNGTPVGVTVTDANGCTDTAEKTLIVNTNPVASISGDDAVCQGVSAIFTANGGLSYLWNIGNQTTQSITVSTTTTSIVTVTDANGCTDTAEKTLTVNANPVASISGDDEVCDGGSVTFTANGGNTYLWSVGNQTTQSITVSTATTAIVTVTDANGCTDTAEKTLTVHPVPDAGPDVSLNCYVIDEAFLNAIGSGTWSYANGPGLPYILDVNQANTIVNNFPSPGTYNLIWSNGFCEDVMSITVGDLCDCPTGVNNISAPSNTTACNEFPQTTINGNDATPFGGNYIWEISINGGAFTNAPGSNVTRDYNTNVLYEGTYTFRRIYRVMANGQDCIYESNPVTLTVYPNPVATITGEDAVCEGQSTTFTASGGTTFDWGLGNTNAIITVSDNTSWMVTVTDSNGCTATAEKTLTIHPNPTAVITGEDNVCEGKSAFFTAEGGVTYLWNTNDPTQTISVSDALTKIVTVTDVNGCTDTAEKSLNFYSNPTASVTGDDFVCEGGSVDFTAEGGVTYFWNTTETTQTISVSDALTKIVTITDSNGCTATAEKTLTVHPVPDAGSDISVNCYVSDVVSMNANGSGIWSQGIVAGTFIIADVNNANTTISGFSAPGTYQFYWSSPFCEDVVTITVGDNCDCPSGDNQITAPALAEICQLYPATLITGNDASPAGGSYEWQINANNTGFVSAGGINNTKDYTTEVLPVGNYIIKRVYTVFVNGQDCIYESNPVNITVHPNPVATISGDDTVCQGESTTFTANGGVDYLWSTGPNTPSITLSTGSTVIVTVTDTNGCTATAERTLTVHPNPVATISGDDSVCLGESTTFTATGGVDYLWSTGPNTPSITLSTGSTVIVTVTDANGCTATAERTLTVHPNPVTTISGDETVCLGESTTFTANGGVDYLWSTGPNTPSITLSTGSTVIVTVTDANGCTATAERTLTVNPNPTATISGDDTICFGESTTFTANGGTDYLWNAANQTTQSITVSTASTIVVTVTDANGCTATAERTLMVNPNPTATISGDDTICFGESTTFTANGGTDYLWNAANQTTQSITVSTASTIVVTVTDANGCTATAERTLMVNPLPNAGPDRSANCYVNDVVTLAATGTGTWSWAASSLTATINNATSATTTISGFPSAGNYELIWSDGNCEDVVTITVSDNCDCPSGDNQITAPALTEVCFEYPATQISGNDASPAGGSYVWQINTNNTGFVSAGGINNTKDYTTEVLPVGNYIIRRVYTVVANGQDCVYESNPVNVRVNPNPTATISGDDTVCLGESTTFTANGGTDYLWNAANLTTQSITVTTASTIVVTVTDANGCTATAERTLTVNPNPVATISGDDTICFGESTTFTANGGTDYLWSSGPNTPSITLFTASIVIVTVTDANGCTATAERTLTVNPLPNAGPDRSANCYVNDVVTLAATGTGTWSWAASSLTATINNATSATTTISGFPSAGNYELIWSDGNCEDVVTITVSDNCDCPSGDNQITAPALTEVCFEYPATQISGNDASPAGGSYVWQINTNNTGFVSAGGINNTKDYTTEVLPVGNYIIRRVYTVVANGQDCVYESNPVNITVNPNPVATISGDETVCQGESTTFTANGGTDYLWNVANQTTQSITVSTASTIVVTVTDANGCTATAERTLMVNPNPTATISGDDTICFGESTTFTADGGTDYLWNVANETTQSITVSLASTFVVTVTDANGCTATAERTLTVNPNPTATISGDDTICFGESTTFTANGGTDYLWNAANQTTQSITVSSASTIVVTVTDANGCTATAERTLTVNPNPTTTISGDDTICLGESTTFTANGGVDYLWNAANQTTQSITVSTASTIVVTVTDANGCTATAERTLTVNPLPNAGPDRSANCYVNDVVTLAATGTGTWSWATSSLTATIDNATSATTTISGFPSAGTYTLIWSDGNCEDVVTITVGDNCDCPSGDNQITAPALTEVCFEYPATQISGNDASPAGGSYVWQINANNTGFISAGGINNTKDYTTEVLPVGNYIIRRVYTVVANGQDCVYESNPVNVMVNPNPTATISGDDTVCQGESTTFTANGGTDYLWNAANQTTQSITVSTASTIVVTVTDANGCTATAERTLTVNPNPVATISGDDLVCLGESTTFTASGGTDYLWSTGPNTPSITLSTGSTVIVTVTDANGCTATAERTLTVNPLPNAGPDRSANCYVNDVVILAATGTGTWTWAASSLTATIDNVNSATTTISGFPSAGTYTLIWSDGICEDVVTITVGDNCDCPSGDNQITAPALAEICFEYPATLIAGNDASPAGGSYEWQINANNNGFVSAGGINNTKDYTTEVLPVGNYIIRRVYTVVANGQDCVYESNPVNVMVNPNPTATISGNDTVCLGESTTFTANGGTDYLWNVANQTTQSITVSTASTIVVTVTDVNGCTATAERTLTVNPNPTATISGDDTICLGESTTFTANGGTDYLWNVANQTTQSITVSTASTIVVTVTDANGCTATAERTLTVNPLPIATIEGITDVCAGESSVFTASGGTSYIWSSSENTDIITVSDNVTRTVTVTDVNNCTSTAQQTLTIHSFPNAGDFQLANCFSKDSVVMNATGTGTWRLISGPGSPTIMDINQSNTIVTNFPAAGKYILGWSNGYCESLVEINVGDQCDCPPGINSVSGPANTSVCVVFPSETLTGILTAPQGGTYQWFYYKNNDSGNIVGTSQDYATGDLDLGNHKYQRVYRLIANNQTCIYNSNIINIDVHPEPIASITGDNIICRGSSTVLTAQGGAQFLWSSAEPTQSITVNDDIERTVTVTNVFGCSDEVSFSVTLNENPVAVISGPDATCFGTSVIFTASGGDQYLWSNGETTNSITVSDDSEIRVTVTDANGCSAVATKTLTILPLPDAGNDRIANCFSSSIVTMNAFGSGTWSFLSGPGMPIIADITNPNTTVSGFPASGTYVLVWNDGNCEDAVSIIVNENCDCPDGDNRINDPNVNVCKIFTSSVLEGNDASPVGGTYIWEYALNSGAFAAAPGINNTEDYITGDLGPGTHSFVRKYSVIIDNKECTYESNTIALRVNNEPVADISGNNVVCSGISSEFVASGGDFYLWNDGSTNPNLLVSVPGEYFVTVTDANACTATASRTLTVLDNPVVTITGDDRICEGGTATFTASGGNEYVWSSGENASVISVRDEIERFVTVTGSNGCSATASKTLIVTEQPSAGPDLLVNCYSRDQATLAGSGTGTWILDPSSSGVLTFSDMNNPNTVVSGFSAPGTYNLILTNGFCEDIMTILVLDNCDCPNQDNSLNPGQEDTACDTYPSTLLSGNEASPAGGFYRWEYNFNNTGYVPAPGNFTDKDYTTTVLGVGSHLFRRIYTVQANGNTCEYISTDVLITVNPNPVAAIVGADSVCEGLSTTFTASGGTNYIWNNGETTPEITVSDDQTKFVTVTDDNGCSDVASKTLSIFNNPTASIEGETSVCEGKEVTFTALGGNRFVWNNGTVSQTIQVSVANTYFVTVTDDNGCSDVASKTLTVFSNPVASISGEDRICFGQSTVFTASGGVSYLWNTNESTSSIEVSDDAEKRVVVTDNNGCTASASKTLIIAPLPDAGPDQSADCYKEAVVTLQASGNGRWTAASSNPTSVLIVNPLSPISEVRGFVRAGVYTFIWNDGFCDDMVIVTIGNNCPCEDVLNEIYEPSETVFCDVVTELTLNGNQPASGNGSFLWEYSFNGGGFISAPGINNLSAFQAQNLNPGTHSFRRFYLFDNENGTVCIDSSNIISVIVIPPVNAEFDVEIHPNPVCAGDTVYVSINAMVAGTYEWNVISGNADIQTYPDRAVFIPQSEGKIVFTVTQTTEFCNFVSQPLPFEFTVNPRPRVALGRDTIICDQDQGFELNIEGDYADITWDNGSKENSIFVEESGVYKVSVTDENGCTGYDEITIKDFCCKVYYPNIISLSSANYINRQFQIKESGCVISSELWIYDRWGNLVYKSEDGLAPWDGIFKGDYVEQGVYAFIFKFKALDENDEEFEEKISGDITILH